MDPHQGGRSRARSRLGAGGRRLAVPAGLGHPLAGLRRRPPQARRCRTSPACSVLVAKAAAQGRGAAMSMLELRGVSKVYGEGACARLAPYPCRHARRRRCRRLAVRRARATGDRQPAARMNQDPVPEDLTGSRGPDRPTGQWTTTVATVAGPVRHLKLSATTRIWYVAPRLRPLRVAPGDETVRASMDRGSPSLRT